MPLVRHHGLAPLAFQRMLETSPGLAALWRADLEAAVGRHLRVRSVLARLSTTLAEAGVDWAVLKGPVLSEHAHPIPGIRPYGDLDLLVRPGDFEAAVRALTAGPWRLLDRNHRLLLARLPGEVHLLGDTGVMVDLHWSLLNMASTRKAFPVGTGPLLDRRRSVTIGAHEVPTLNRTDLLLHTCLHAALTGADRLLLLVDVHQQVRQYPPVWEELVERAREWGAGPAAATVLGRCVHVLGTDVPRRAMRLLAGRPWLAINAATDLLSPVHRRSGGGSLARIVARSSRPDTAASLIELLSRSRRYQLRQPSTVESLLVDRPDREALSRYLAAVSSEGG